MVTKSGTSCGEMHDIHSSIKVAVFNIPAVLLSAEHEGRGSRPDIVTHLYQTEIKSILVCCSLFDILLLHSKDGPSSARYLNTIQMFRCFQLSLCIFTMFSKYWSPQREMITIISDVSYKSAMLLD